MRRSFLALAAAAALALPGSADAQLGVAARAGTLGIGGEVALGLGSALVVRGGMGLVPLEVPVSFWDIGTETDVKLHLPDRWYNIGADLYLGGPFRIGAGLLFKSTNLSVTGTVQGTAQIDIGGVPYSATEIAEIEGRLVSKDRAPYVLIGFGKHTSTGIGLFVDLGLAMTGEPTIELEATQGDRAVIDSPPFQALLADEQQTLQDALPTWSKYWPIVNIGLRVGLGG